MQAIGRIVGNLNRVVPVAVREDRKYRPRISSRAIVMSLVTSAKIVARTK
jgi:hypothetical protein